MKRDLGAIYSREWFEQDFAELGPEFELAAKAIARWAAYFGLPGNASILDMGCGPGLLVDALHRCGFNAIGFDGSPHAIEYAKARGGGDRIWCEDILAYRPTLSMVVVCTEVAEHVPAEDAPALVKRLTSSAIYAVIFTAAAPGQGGHDHVNEQPKEYWIDLFAEHGWLVDPLGTHELAERWRKLDRLSHMPRNLMVFR